MKINRPVKTKIKQLVRRLGGYKEVAKRLDIALSYVYRLEKGAIPGKRLYKDIVNLHKRI